MAQLSTYATHGDDMAIIAHLRRLPFTRNKEQFDAIGVRNELVRIGKLPRTLDTPDGNEPAILRHFTEPDPRKYALWHMSMFWQYQPADLKKMTDDDLLYMAGQSPEGYPEGMTAGIELNKNKVTQNSLRAKVELETRAIRISWHRTVALGLVTVFASSVLTALAAAWFVQPQAGRSPDSNIVGSVDAPTHTPRPQTSDPEGSSTPGMADSSLAPSPSASA